VNSEEFDTGIPEPARASSPKIGSALFSAQTGWAVLAVSLALTGLAWHYSAQYIESRAADKFATQVIAIEDLIKQRMTQYVQVLKSGVGLFNASNNVDRGEWRSFINALNINKNYPGTQGVGVSVPIMPDQLQSHIASLQSEGFLEYAVNPKGKRDRYTAIVYLEPFDWRNQRALGYDMYSEPNRRAAMNHAIDTGLPSISSMVTLKQETDADVQAGFLMYLPVYEKSLAENPSVQQRRDGFKLMVYAVLRATDLMENVLASIDENVVLRLYDGNESEDALLYESDNQSSIETRTLRFNATKTLNVYGHSWLMSVNAKNPTGFQSAYWQSTAVGIGGLLVDILLFCIIHLIGKRGRDVERELYTKSLERSNSDLERFAHAASHDLKAPLRAIDNLASWIAKDSADVLSEKSNRHLRLLQERSTRLETLLDDLLVYSKAAALDSELEVVDMAELTSDVIDILAISDAMVVEIEPFMPTVIVERTPVRQVLLNLVSNACKHHDRENGHIRLRCQFKAGLMVFDVADDGPGVPIEFRNRVFTMFETLQGKDTREGSGIGLALVNKLVTDHGGTITIVEPELLDRGTQFRFTWKAELASLATATSESRKRVKTKDCVSMAKSL
jgi:signal transduction histidine kinase